MFVSKSFSFIFLAGEWQEEGLLFIIYFQMIFFNHVAFWSLFEAVWGHFTKGEKLQLVFASNMVLVGISKESRHEWHLGHSRERDSKVP